MEVAVIWGLAMVVVGALMVLGARTQSNFIAYRLIAARARILWGNRVHAFLQVSGLLVILAGVLAAALS
jgi:hypothetical protein